MTPQGPIADIYPLSPVQQGILFHLLAEKGREGLYLCQTTCRLQGDLDREAFRRALERLVERHDALRTSLLWEEVDQPLQVVEVEVPVPLAEEDWSTETEEKRRCRLEAYIAADRARGFDLGRASMTRLLLAREGQRSHRLVWTLPMVLVDGWSTSVLIRDLFALYDALRNGAEPSLPAPERYRDFIAWRMRQDLAEAEHFWRRDLEGFTQPTPLPGSPGRGGVPALAEHDLHLDEGLTAELLERAGAERLTLNTLLQGVWALWLARSSGRSDVVFGTTVSGRPPELSGVDSMVGVFINTLPVRATVDPEAAFLDWLRALQERQAEARHYDYPLLVDIHGWSGVPRGVPLFESLVVYENYPVETSLQSPVPGLVVEEVHWSEVTNYPLALVGMPGRRLTLRLIHDTARFELGFVRRLTDQIAALLETALRRPGAKAGELSLLFNAESGRSASSAGGAAVDPASLADPADIEAVLAMHPRLRESAVAVRRDCGQRRFVAFVVPDGAGPAPAPGELRDWLAERLPEARVPAAVVALPELPRRPNGRLDRRVLAALDLEETPEAINAAEASDSIQDVIATIWCDVLERQEVGAHQSFFALGGHSLHAARVISRLRSAFGVEVPIHALFEARTVAGLAQRLREALRAGEAARPEPLVFLPREGGMPLSFAQERLWFLDLLQPGNPVYNVALAVRLDGALDLACFAACLCEVTARHEALRTTFEAPAGEPRQRIGPPGAVRLPLVDLEALPPEARMAATRDLARGHARQPFDLARGPLLRGAVVRHGACEHVLLLAFHHVAVDGWSLGVLLREIAALYPAFLAGRPSPLPLLPIQPADFAAWQRRHLRGETLRGLLVRWRERLAGADGSGLPADRQRPAVQRHCGRTLTVALPADLTASLHRVSNRAGATLYMTLLAGFAALVQRHSGASRLALGAPVAGRTRPEMEQLIGLFINTLVMTPDLAGDPSCEEMQRRVRSTVIDAQMDQELPFELLVEALRPERDLSRQPLFQMMFQLHNTPLPELRIGDLDIVPLEIGTGVAKFDLTVGFHTVDGVLRGSFEYALDLYDGVTIERLARQLMALLAALACAPERRLSELDAMPAAERHQLLREDNDTAAPRAWEFVHQRFREQAERAPAATAVVAKDRRWTYGELSERVDRLARSLRRLGSAPERRVGVHLRRGPELVAALFAVLESGAAYVPLDPDHPAERLGHLIEAAGCDLVLTVASCRGSLPPFTARIVDVDEELAGDGEGREAPATALLPSSLAYVLFTSGSTGEPKGVMVSHGGLAAYLDWAVRAYGLGPGSAVPLHSSPSFDLTVTSLFCPLVAGGMVAVVPEEGGAAALAETLAGDFEMVKLTPGHLELLRLLPAAEGRGRVAVLVLGGEALQGSALEWAGARFPGVRVVNEYGPTETVVGCCANEIPPGPVPPGPVPIGRPIAGARLYAVDRDLRPVPAGGIGELCIAGAGVARGYLGRPDLTAQRFLPDPFSTLPGERLYRSGDLVRRQADGALVYLGRIDHQVKVRGYRIEPGEIEAQLLAHPGVGSAAVAALPDRFGERRLVAWIVPQGKGAGESELRAFLAAKLPEYMVPAVFVELDAMPYTASGKVDRKALPPPSREPRAFAVGFRGPVERAVSEIWCEVLERDEVGLHESFFDAGGSSLRLVRVQARLRERLGRELPLVDLFRHPTVASLAGLLAGAAVAAPAPMAAAVAREVAIVGMSCRVPGAASPAELWCLLREGIEGISSLSDESLAASDVPAEQLADSRYVKRRGILAGVEEFDAGFFGVSPREAELLDPQHRLFLECAWHALEDAGHAGCGGQRIGVFAGSGLSRYGLMLLARPGTAPDPALLAANDKDFLAARVSYKLDLRGPSVAVQSACSSSLVAVRMACRSLLDDECDMSLAGGVSIGLPQPSGYLYEEGGILSPDGRCRAFDAAAAGTVPGSGVGIVVLKRLEDALADGDRIYAVIKGSGLTNDGADKVGFSAPSVRGQAAAIRAALAEAGVDASSVSYVETHGTGTALGDPIEIAALREAHADRQGRCALGAVKTSLGHLDAAAGVVGLIKTTLALAYRELPPTLHFERPHPALGLEESPFFVNTGLAPWDSPAGPRRAGVSSFGIGGTNIHLILEEAPAAEPEAASRPWQLLVWSARSEAAAGELARGLAESLRRPGAALPDLAHTLRVGRRRFPVRRALVCRDAEEALGALSAPGSPRILEARDEAVDRPVAFLFPGQGAQHPGMGAGLYRGEETYRGLVDRCCELLQPHLGVDLRALLDPDPGREEEAAERLQRTALAQPALFTVEYALARQWMEWGVTPEAMAGHSVGELVAACLADVFSLEEALALVAARGRLMDALAPGAMLSVELPESEIAGLPGRSLSLAAANGPAQCVLAGQEEEIAALAAHLAGRGVPHTRLRTSHAFHSWMMEPVLEAFGREVSGIALRPPRIPFASCVTGRWILDGEAIDPAYWVRQLRATVRFGDAVATVCGEPRALITVGPGHGVSALVRRAPEAAGLPIASSLGHPRELGADDQRSVLEALGRLWLAGVRVDWQGFVARERRRRVEAPLSPFERRRYWIDTVTASPAAERGSDPAGWFYLPTWRRTAPPGLLKGAPEPDAVALVVLDSGELGEAVVRALGERVAVAVRPDFGEEELESLLAAAWPPGRPLRVLHLASLDGAAGWRERLDRAADLGFHRLVQLARVIGRRGSRGPVRLGVVTRGAQEVHGDEDLAPEHALVLGLVRCLPAEYPNLSCRAIDVDLAGADEAAVARLAGWLADEMEVCDGEPAVAYRGGHRWVEGFEPVRLGALRRPPLRQGGVYLITGGLGGIGLAIARHLTTVAEGVRLVLSGRSVPSPDALRAVEELKALGAEVAVETADATDAREMAGVLARVRQRFGALHGVVHAAGVPPGGLIQNKTREVAERVFLPKVRGAFVLDELLAGERLDFLVLCSSLRSVLGGAGKADYAAANAFLDAFAVWRHRQGRPTLALDWDTWSEVGMSVAGVAQRAAWDEEGLQDGLSCAEGVEAFARALASGLPRLLVSTVDLPRRIERARAFSAAEALERIDGERAPSASVHERPRLASAYVAPRDEAERLLAGVWQDLLGIETVGVHDDFFELGGDSVVSIQVIARARKLGLELTPAQVFESGTVAELAAVSGSARALRADQGPVTGEVPLSPVQTWFFGLGLAAPWHWNQALMLQVLEPVESSRFHRAVGLLLRHHDALRLRFRRDADGWRQWSEGEAGTVPSAVVDLSDLPEALGRRAAEAAAAQAQASLDLANGPTLRALLFLWGEGRPARLLLVIHHLAVDAVSWRILLEDLQTACRGLAGTGEVRLPEKTSSFRDWAVRLCEEVAAGRFAAELQLWTSALRGGARPLPRDRQGGNAVRSARRLAVVVSEEDSRILLHEAQRKLRAEAQDVLLTALAGAFRAWTGERRLLVDVEGHGREPFAEGIDVSRTVGWFTALHSVLLELPAAGRVREALAAVREQLAALPFTRLGHGALRYLSSPETAAAFAGLPRAEVQFLYLGQAAADSMRAMFTLAEEAPGPLHAPDGARTHLIQVTASAAGGRLEVSWDYSDEVHLGSTVEHLAQAFLTELRALLDLCHAPEPPLYTPADFPQAGLDLHELQDLLRDLASPQEGGLA